MKKHIITILTLIFTLSLILSGCSAIGSLKNGSFKTNDGEIIAGDNVKWPESNMGGLNKPDAKITAVIKDDASGSYNVAFSDMSNEKATQYIADLKKHGYQSIMEVNDADGVMFSGKNSGGVMVTFTYNNTAKEGTVSYLPNSPDSTMSSIANPSDSAVSNKPNTSNSTNQGDDSQSTSSKIDMTDVSPWPQDFLSGVPELKGKIVNVLKQNNDSATIDIEYVEKTDFEAYVGTLKQNGFTVDSDETKDSYSYEYRAYNQKGDNVYVTMNYEYKKVMVYIQKAVTD